MIDYEMHIAFSTTKASKALNDSFNNVVLKYGVTRSQCVAMYYINLAKAIGQKELAEKMNIRESTMTGLLDRMQRDGLIDRKLDDEDMRKKTISLSKKGYEKLDELIVVADDFISNAVKDLKEEDIDVFKKVLKSMVKSTLEWEEKMVKSI